MKSSQRKQKFLIPALVIALGLAAIIPLGAFVESQRPALPAGYGDSDLFVEASRMRGFSFGFEGLLADLYWMRSLQYIGDKVLKSKQKVNIDDLRPLNPRLLYPYLDAATTLDPRFIEAYSYGAVVLPAIDKDRAIAIAQKGIRNNPDEWRLYNHLGYIYWRLGDFERAAEIYGKGAEIGSAPPFMKMIALRMKTQGESRTTAREIYRQMYQQSAADRQIRDFARSRLLYLDSLDEREAVNAILKKYREKSGKCVARLAEIYPELAQIKLPDKREFRIDQKENLVDPSGVPYILDRENCRIATDRENSGLPLQ